jgi:predicted NBD/HSP70 family sugar kinase
MLTIDGITARAAAGLRHPVGYDELLDLAVDGDPLARRVVDDSARALGRLVAAIGNLTTPKKIVLTGDGIRLPEVGALALKVSVLNAALLQARSTSRSSPRASSNGRAAPPSPRSTPSYSGFAPDRAVVSAGLRLVTRSEAEPLRGPCRVTLVARSVLVATIEVWS